VTQGLYLSHRSEKIVAKDFSKTMRIKDSNETSHNIHQRKTFNINGIT
jgi:hypothetical protein